MDDYSGLKCIELLRNIAHCGRTVVCSIHTPSARMFEMFDHVYVVAKGKCAYQGKGQNIVQFVREINIACPRHYNPADFSKTKHFPLNYSTERYFIIFEISSC